MNKIGIILLDNVRSRAYIQKSFKNKINFEDIILLKDKKDMKNFDDYQEKIALEYGFLITESVETTLKNHNTKFTKFDFTDINEPKLIEFLYKTGSEFFIFSGGGILKPQILSIGKKFIHFHPGIVPEFRGSTCFYYSILEQGNCGVTAFIMDKNLDTGDIIFQKKFEKPNHIYIDDIFDAHIRSETLMDVFTEKLLSKGNFKKQNPNNGETYFIIHPVLKHIAILNCVN